MTQLLPEGPMLLFYRTCVEWTKKANSNLQGIYVVPSNCFSEQPLQAQQPVMQLQARCPTGLKKSMCVGHLLDVLALFVADT